MRNTQGNTQGLTSSHFFVHMYCFTIIRQDSRLIPGILSPRRAGPPPAWTSSFPERSSFLPVTRVPSAAFCFSPPQRQRQSNKTGCQGRLSVAIVTFCVRMCYVFFFFAFCILHNSPSVVHFQRLAGDQVQTLSSTLLSTGVVYELAF